MAERAQGICRVVAETYGGDASGLWREAGTAAELHRRLAALPGFGQLKARIVTGLLVRRFGVTLPGWEQVVPDFPTLADVTTADERRSYQAAKRGQKAAMRAEGAQHPPRRAPSRAVSAPTGSSAGSHGKARARRSPAARP
jgi:uncharacterized HhH-GPD family protein